MNTLVINEKKLQYVGLPLAAFTFEHPHWGGLTNFLCGNEKLALGKKIYLYSIEDCFGWMKKWFANPNVICGYVLDYSTKTIYYSDQAALDYLLKKLFPKNKEENYFENFIQKNFSI